LVSSVFVSGCGIKKAADIDRDTKKKIADIKKENDDILDQLRTLMTEGGQPGQIKISGVVVNENSETDHRITMLAKTGVGKDGSQPQIAPAHAPALSQTNDNVDLSHLTSKKDLVAIGCDEKIIANLALMENLEIQKLPDPISEDVLTVSAKLVVLCGQLENLKFDFVTVQADELVMDSVDFTKTGWLGKTTFSANKLHLMGANKITAKGIDSSMILAPVHTIELNVMKELSSSNDGTLSVQSYGANYKAETK